MEHWDNFFDAAQRQRHRDHHHHLRPAGLGHAQGQYVGYQMFDCDLDAFREDGHHGFDRVTRGSSGAGNGSTRSRPAAPPDYVSDYVKLCRAGVEAARAVDPRLAFGPGRRALAARLPARRAQRRRRQVRRRPADPLRQRRRHPGGPRGPRFLRPAKVEVWENESCAFVIQWDCPGLDSSRRPASATGSCAMDRRAGRRLRKADLLRRRGRARSATATTCWPTSRPCRSPPRWPSSPPRRSTPSRWACSRRRARRAVSTSSSATARRS